LPRIGISGRCDPLAFSKYLDGAEHFQEIVMKSWVGDKAKSV